MLLIFLFFLQFLCESHLKYNFYLFNDLFNATKNYMYMYMSTLTLMYILPDATAQSFRQKYFHL